MAVAGITLSENSAYRSGGGIDNEAGTAKITDSIISGNTANDGGVISTGYGGGTGTQSKLIINGKTQVMSNQANRYGGGINIVTSARNSVMATFDGNKWPSKTIKPSCLIRNRSGIKDGE